jgi:hypothetical protein
MHAHSWAWVAAHSMAGPLGSWVAGLTNNSLRCWARVVPANVVWRAWGIPVGSCSGWAGWARLESLVASKVEG